MYAFTQNVGVVNDHIHGCFRGTDFPSPANGGAHVGLISTFTAANQLA